MAVLVHGKSLSLHIRKSYGHGDLSNMKGSVPAYVNHYSEIRLITSGVGVIADIYDFLACNLQPLIVATGKSRLTLFSVTSSVMSSVICTW